MKKIILYAALAFSSGLLFTNLYNSIVNAANWQSNVPHSITATKNFFVVANPGTFFGVIDPANLILVLLALVLLWKQSATIRICLGLAILCDVASMVLTFTYFYPRNEIMFLTEQLPDAETLSLAANEWGRMNWVRSALWLAGLICLFMAMDKYNSIQKGKTA